MNKLHRGRPASWLLLAGLLISCAPASVPPPALRMQAADVTLARQAYEEMLVKFPAYADAAVQTYVQKVGARLAAGAPAMNFPLRFTVLDSPGVFAYSFAHGEVVIGRGLLAHLNSEAQLAAVLAHEIGHVVSLHPLRQAQEARKLRALEAKLSARLGTPQGRDTVNAFSLARARGYSREYEVQADVWSERLLARAGYDPGAMAQVLRFFIQQDLFWDKEGFELWEIPEFSGGEGVFATHPSPDERLQQTLQRQASARRDKATTDAAYLRALNGMIYGLPQRYGVQRGHVYMHPTWRVAFTLPSAWYLFGANERLVAAPRGGDGLLMMWMKPRASNESAHRALEQLARGGALESVTLHDRNGIKGETAITRLPDKDENRNLRLAILDIGEWRLQVVGYTYASKNWIEADNGFRALLHSARVLSQAEARRAQPWRLRLEAPRQDGALPPVDAAFSDHAREQWQLLNQIYPHGRLAAPLIKMVR